MESRCLYLCIASFIQLSSLRLYPILRLRCSFTEEEIMRIVRILSILIVGMVIASPFHPLSAQPIGTYPTKTVELQEGVLICDTKASLLQVLKDRSTALLSHEAFEVPEDCGMLLPGIHGDITYLMEYQDDLLRADVVEYRLYRMMFGKVRIPLGVAYGFGETYFKIVFDPTLPVYHI